jgi:alcohol dehydrogenase class IV
LFEFITSSRVLFGSGCIAKLPEVVLGFGRRVLLVTGSNVERGEFVQALLATAGCAVCVFRVSREPKVTDIQQGVSLCRTWGADVVVGFGGGSALDSAKAIAVVSTNPGELVDYLELKVVGHVQSLSVPGLPCIAVPTTAGTGAEVTRNAVIDVPEQSTKVSLRGSFVLARVALIDPKLTLSLPPSVTAATGFDALTQVIEPFLSNRHNPLVDALAKEGVRLAAKALPRVYANGADLAAREDMALVSLLGGFSLTNAGLGAVHGLAGPLGGLFRAPHGALCAALLAPTLSGNLKVLNSRADANSTEQWGRYRELGRILTSRDDATAEDAIGFVTELTEQLNIPKLSSYGVTTSHFESIIERALRASSMQYNSVKLSAEDLTAILSAAL